MNYWEWVERREMASAPISVVELPDMLVAELSEDTETGRHLVEAIRAQVDAVRPTP